MYTETLHLSTQGPGLYEFTGQVQQVFLDSDAQNGLLVLFIPHTSASLLIQENADPTAKHDLEVWLNNFLSSEEKKRFRHTLEGPDDMPAHIKASITPTSLTIPIYHGALTLGTWQGIYLWEHRRSPKSRKVVCSIQA